MLMLLRKCFAVLLLAGILAAAVLLRVGVVGNQAAVEVPQNRGVYSLATPSVHAICVTEFEPMR
jgi:hypothetical protein